MLYTNATKRQAEQVHMRGSQRRRGGGMCHASNTPPVLETRLTQQQVVGHTSAHTAQCGAQMSPSIHPLRAALYTGWWWWWRCGCATMPRGPMCQTVTPLRKQRSWARRLTQQRRSAGLPAHHPSPHHAMNRWLAPCSSSPSSLLRPPHCAALLLHRALQAAAGRPGRAASCSSGSWRRTPAT